METETYVDILHVEVMNMFFFFLNSYALSYLPTANSDIRQEFDHVSCGIADSFGVEPLKFQGRRFLFL